MLQAGTKLIGKRGAYAFERTTIIARWGRTMPQACSRRNELACVTMRMKLAATWSNISGRISVYFQSKAHVRSINKTHGVCWNQVSMQYSGQSILSDTTIFDSINFNFCFPFQKQCTRLICIGLVSVVKGSIEEVDNTPDKSDSVVSVRLSKIYKQDLPIFTNSQSTVASNHNHNSIQQPLTVFTGHVRVPKKCNVGHARGVFVFLGRIRLRQARLQCAVRADDFEKLWLNTLRSKKNRCLLAWRQRWRHTFDCCISVIQATLFCHSYDHVVVQCMSCVQFSRAMFAHVNCKVVMYMYVKQLRFEQSIFKHSCFQYSQTSPPYIQALTALNEKHWIIFKHDDCWARMIASLCLRKRYPGRCRRRVWRECASNNTKPNRNLKLDSKRQIRDALQRVAATQKLERNEKRMFAAQGHKSHW